MCPPLSLGVMTVYRLCESFLNQGEWEEGQPSNRTVHPLGLFYWGRVWTLPAWCELRDEFRCFRLDRMTHVSLQEAVFKSLPGWTLQNYLRTVCDG